MKKTATDVFQSTLPRGERPTNSGRNAKRTKFQSTLPRGERRDIPAVLPLLQADFNPRSHEGSDFTVSVIFPFTFTFQSTLPRGERRIDSGQLKNIVDFNPRSHEGSDKLWKRAVEFINISIHAPTRGATLLWIL